MDEDLGGDLKGVVIMKILVTGGCGFIGSHTVDALLRRGHEVRVIDSLEPPVHNGKVPDYLPAEVDFIHGSVTDRAVFRRALDGMDAVFHFAAYQDYLPDFSRFFGTNSVGTALLYELIVNERLPVTRVVVASSQAVYGEGKNLCPTHGTQYPGQRSREQLERGDWEVRCPQCFQPLQPQWTDEAVTAAHNSYGLSKRDQEDIALQLGRRYGIGSVALRYSIVQGPRQSFRNAYSGALRSFAVRVLTGQTPVIFEDGEQQRDYVSIPDVVEANLLALEDSRADFQVFNVGGNRRMTVREIAQLCCEVAGVDFTPEPAGLYRLGDTRHIFSDVSRFGALGWTPRVDQRAMVREYLEWAGQQPDLREYFSGAERVMKGLGVIRPVRGKTAA
jgi:dTDP-L-rhamnose 4-epimerase